MNQHLSFIKIAVNTYHVAFLMIIARMSHVLPLRNHSWL